MQIDPQGKDENVEAIRSGEQERPISAALERLIAPLHAEFPGAYAISFEYRRDLHLHIDLRTLEEAHVVEARLPGLCGGVFEKIFTGASPHHPFFHRVSAKVNL